MGSANRPAAQEKYYRVAHGLLGPGVLLLAQRYGDVGARSHAYQQPECYHHYREGEYHAYRADPRRSHRLPDEEPVYDVVEGVRHHADDRGQREAQHQAADRVGPHRV
jgi:hypothetical protein